MKPKACGKVGKFLFYIGIVYKNKEKLNISKKQTP